MGSLKSAVSACFGRNGTRRRGMPLSLFLAKYFIYILLGTFLLAGITVSLLIVAVDSGVLYPANYASINKDATVGAIEERGTVSADDIPSCYRWGVFDKEGRLAEGDLDAHSRELATGFLQEGAEDAVVYPSPLGSPVYTTSASLESGATCVLVYDFNPDFVSKALRDTLPDPQGAMLCAAAVLFAGMVALIAMRASRMMKRKLSPLVDAAGRIGCRELDFDIPRGTIRETNDVLEAVDDMRVSLKASLEAQWTAEQAQREALSALAHDLKTPLTIVRGNADLLLEGELDENQEGYARFIRAASDDMEEFIGRIMAVSRAAEDEGAASATPVSARTLCDDAVREAAALVGGRAGGFSSVVGDIPENAFVVAGAGMVQAAMNLVDNAFAYGAPPVTLRCAFRREKPASHSACVDAIRIGWLDIVVEDAGPGFSDAALAHAAERFYRDDAARTRDGRHGLGLAIAADRARAAGGSLTWENTEHGARTTLELPCYDGAGKNDAP